MTEALEGLLRSRVAGASPADARAIEWLERALAATDADALLTNFTLAPRKLGARALEATAGERAALEREGLAWILASSSLEELARIVLVRRAVSLAGDGGPSIAAEWYRQGDSGEKRAVLRALALVLSPDKHVELGAVACRSSVQSVFEAIACENPYPATWFSELAFNQMVLKALFTGVALARIDGLERRKNADLARMAADYAAERRAAGRSVPADIGDVLAAGERRD
jgi:hypothetical protein